MKPNTFIRKAIVVLLGSLLFGNLAFAQSAEPLKVALTTNPATLDAHQSTTTAVQQVGVYLYESLVTFDEEYEVIPQLAQDWDISADRLTYTFHLREGVKFHNGETLDAEDVKASVERYINVSAGGSRFSEVSNIEVKDERTVVFHLTNTTPLLVNMAQPTPSLAIFPKSVVDEYPEGLIPAQSAIGTGPYEIVEWRPDVYVHLKRFNEYVPDERFEEATGFGGRREALIEEIQLIPVPEAASRIAGIETGEFDFIEAVPITSVNQLGSTEGVDVTVLKPKWAILVELNQAEPPMDDVRFRQALVRALDMEQIMVAASTAQEDFYRLQPSIFFPEQAAWYSEAGGDWYNNQDIEEAKRLLEESGYNNEEVIYLANRDFDWMYKAALAATSQWQQIGINVSLEFSDWPTQIARAESGEGWHVNQTGWSPRLDPTQIHQSLACDSVASYNYCNEKMEGLLERVNQGLPQEEREAVWNEIQELVWDDVAIIRFGDFHEAEAINSDLQGYRPFYVTPRFWNVER